jgi:RNA polymerase sigma factor (sigma-70 family)
MRTEDGKIIGQCLNGETEVFGLLVDKYKASIYALVYSKIRNFHDAQDITQEVFLEAYRDLRTLRYRDSFLWWLYSIAYNNCRNWLRAQSKRPDSTFIEDSAPEGVERLVQATNIENQNDNPMDEHLHKALDSLPDKYKEVLTLYYLGGMDSIEIAKALCTTPSAIRQRLSRARVQLKGELVDMMGESFRQRRLDAVFTFRIIELVKRIKIEPTPSLRGLPWGLSLATGILITLFSININLTSTDRLMYFHNLPLADSSIQQVGEYPVDIAKVSETSVISEQQGSDNGLGTIVPNAQNALFMAPQADGGTWTKKADMPTARHSLSASSFNGKIYTFGGFDNNGCFSVVEEYDPIEDTWTKKANMPTSRGFLSTCSINDKIYAIGGMNAGTSFSVVEEYNPIANKWTRKADMLTARSHFGASMMNDKIYVFGGLRMANMGQEQKNITSVEEYDLADNKWIEKSEIPIEGLTWACTIKDKIYVAIMNAMISKSIMLEEYDPATNKWERKADMPPGRRWPSVCTLDGKLYAIGGMSDDDTDLTTVEEYDPASDTWTRKTDIPTGRFSLSSSESNGLIYAIGGMQGNNNVWNGTRTIPTVEEYNPKTESKSIDFKGKFPTTWGDTKLAQNK